jgi:hypothetical protein
VDVATQVLRQLRFYVQLKMIDAINLSIDEVTIRTEEAAKNCTSQCDEAENVCPNGAGMNPDAV